MTFMKPTTIIRNEKVRYTTKTTYWLLQNDITGK